MLVFSVCAYVLMDSELIGNTILCVKSHLNDLDNKSKSGYAVYLTRVMPSPVMSLKSPLFYG